MTAITSEPAAHADTEARTSNRGFCGHFGARVPGAKLAFRQSMATRRFLGSSSSRTSCSATLALVLLGLSAAACGDDTGGGSGGGGAGATSTTTSATTSQSTSTTSGGGAGEGGSGGASEGGAGGGASACEAAVAGEPCAVEGESCEHVGQQEECGGEGLPFETSCVAGRWEKWAAVTCDAFVPPDGCEEIPGRYLVEPSGAYEPPTQDDLIDDYGDPFEVTFEVRDDGRLWVWNGGGVLDPGSCEIWARFDLSEECEEDGAGDVYCRGIDRELDLDFSQEPAAGDVRIQCFGETCGQLDAVTAPVTATPQDEE